MIKILLIEPSQKIRDQLSEAFKKLRYQVSFTSWAEEALTVLLDQSINAVMVRDNLEGMSASSFIREINRSDEIKDKPMVIVYGKCDPKKRIELWRAGAHDVIEMPFVLPEVLLRVNTRVQSRYQGAVQIAGDEEFAPEAVSVESLPGHGGIDSRPVPQCMSLLFLSGATGVLRFIEGKHIRSFYFEKGFIRGASSSRKDESLQRLMLKWLTFPGDSRKSFKSLSETTPDSDIAQSARHLCGIQNEVMDSIAVRYMHYVAQGCIRMTRGEFDWTPDEKPGDILLVNFRGLQPVHLLLTVIRDTTPPPDYSSFITQNDDYLAPNANLGIIRNSYRLTAPEMCVTSLTASGITISNWLKQAEIVLPYARAFIYIMMAFKIITAVERSELRADEIAAVALPEPVKDDVEEDIVDVKDDEAKSPSRPPQQPVRSPAPTTPPTPPKSEQKHQSLPDDYESVTEVDIRPLKNRILRPHRPEPKKSLLEKEMESLTAPAKPRQYQSIKERMARIKNRNKGSTSALEMYDIDISNLKSGHTWDNHPALICNLVIENRKTGILIFSDAASETRLYWQHGNLVYAKSDKPSLRIDEVLFKLGIINEDQKEAAGNLWNQYGGMRSGTGLFRQNIVSIMDLTEAVKEQIRMIIEDICNMPAGDYTFVEGPLPEAEYIAFDVHTYRILLQGIRGMDDMGNLEKIVPNLNARFNQQPGSPEKAQELHLEAIDIIVLNKFRKSSSAKAGFAGMDLSLQKYKNTIAGLFLIGLLEKQE